MADRRISEFLDGGLVQSGDEIAAVRGGNNYKVRFGTAAAYDAGQSGGDLVILEEDSSGTVMLPAVDGSQLTGLSVSDPTVQVSATDADAGYLEDKILGSGTVTITKETDSSGSEILRVDLAGGGGIVQIDGGGTGATTAAGARTNLGLDYAAVIATKEIIGLTVSNNTSDAEHDIDIAAGRCWSSDLTTIMSLPSTITKQLDTTFTEGNNVGGMAAGESLPTSGTIHIWLISKDDGTTDVMANNDADSGLSPALPSGFTKIRYLWSLTTDASANIREGSMMGDVFLYGTEVASISNVTVPTSATSYTLAVPSGVPIESHFDAIIFRTTSASARISLWSPMQADKSVSTARCSLGGGVGGGTSYFGSGQYRILTNTSSQIRAIAENTNTVLSAFVTGWRNLSRGVL